MLLADFLPYAETVPLQNDPLDLPTVRDCADLMFLSLAVMGKAETLVTGENDLLVLKNTFALPIMTIIEFEDWLNATYSLAATFWSKQQLEIVSFDM